ncbi:hypothetical protein [Kitasatospora sp. CB01950]|uniref:hypothetical protein n=1 Tax=Kitasatospora sp. CB01950 TaxID=1703930 RepID=UPI00093C6F2F|nr:hypothetical protein [Kitasatospora sp. CB01950]OKJ15775.1 hypothetical protein AMK19_05820 [Kitasatospora sp. CB01950]
MERIESEGGEAACWLNLVCEECGKVRERGRCPVCDAGPEAEAESDVDADATASDAGSGSSQES